MQKWKYYTIRLDFTDEYYTQKMEHLGEEGWECYQILSGDTKHLLHFFKRPYK